VQRNSARMQAYMRAQTTKAQDRAMLQANLEAWVKLESVMK